MLKEKNYIQILILNLDSLHQLFRIDNVITR